MHAWAISVSVRVDTCSGFMLLCLWKLWVIVRRGLLFELSTRQPATAAPVYKGYRPLDKYAFRDIRTSIKDIPHATAKPQALPKSK